MEKPRKRYIQQFKQYPDVVSVLTFREMLGGIGDSFARKLIHEGLVKAIFIKPHYWIFKESATSTNSITPAGVTIIICDAGSICKQNFSKKGSGALRRSLSQCKITRSAD